jgi:mediator of RNA polymerase II transcription subunit 12
MVDHGTVLSWLGAQIAPANIAQLYFVLRLVEEYLDDLAQHRMFVKPVIEGCLAKLVEVLLIYLGICLIKCVLTYL